LYLQGTNSSKEVLEQFMERFADFGSVLGITFKQEKALLDEDVDQLIEERNEARKQRNFSRADEIRDELKEQGILLEDTPQGVRWKRM
ncbi:cysteine--tRNA ligase, partial [Pantoea sp. SIMBA_133]